MINRRQWNRREWIGSALGGMVALGAPAPLLWRRALAAPGNATNGRMLVVIELDGGNDGLNTVVPYADDLYHRARPSLRIPPGTVLKLDDHLGLHPSLKEVHKLSEQGFLRVVENVGYPSPSRSHFRSMEIWQSGNVDAPQPTGWLGRAAEKDQRLGLCFVGDTTIPLAVRQHSGAALSVGRLADLHLQSGARLPSADPDRQDVSRLIEERMRAIESLGGHLPSPSSIPAASSDEDENRLVEPMQAIRALAKQELGLRGFYSRLSGFDTHSSQRYTQAQLLAAVSRGIGTLFDGLRQDGLDDRVAVLVFSEFGRRVAQNGQNGTDHGAAAPILLVGPGVAGGISGGPPDLANLDGGDVRHQIDFRDVYASVLTDWLGVDAGPVLGRQAPESLALFRAPA